MIQRAAQRGASLVELLVSLAIVGVVLAGMSSSMFFRAGTLSDRAVMSAADTTAQILRDQITFDLRMIGAGMPLTQEAFMASAAAGEARLPILTSADNGIIELRFKPSGESAVLTSEYTPGAADLSFDVTSAEGFRTGDRIYLSSLIAGGDGALAGTVSGIAGNRITIASDYVASPGAFFPAGSSADRVVQYRYDSSEDWSGVTRDIGNGPVMLAPNTAFSLEYLDEDRNSIALPLSTSEILDELAYIRVTVFARPQRPLKSYETYQAEATQLVSLRNPRLAR